MKRAKKLLLPLVLVLCCASASAQGSEFEQILLPIGLEQSIAGGYGSVWKTELWVRNAGENPIEILNVCNVECPPYLLAPGAALKEPPIGYQRVGGPPGAFVSADARFADNLQISLRIRDLSRQELTWGTELPVVRRADLRVGTIGLLDVPLETRFRQTLRLYSMATEPIGVTVSFFEIPSLAPEAALAARTFTITPATEYAPGYAQLLDFVSAIPELAGKERVYVEIRSDSALPFWGFISVTNNETQHVTTITPR